MGEQDDTNDTNRQDVPNIPPADNAPHETPHSENNLSPENATPAEDTASAAPDYGPPPNADAGSLEIEAPAALPVPPPDLPPRAETPQQEHSNILKNVGMSAESSPPLSPSEPAPEISSARATSSTFASSSILSSDELPIRGLVARRARVETKLDKILALAEKHGSLKNDDVEKVLHISDATATRYLAILVKNGALLRTGAPGHARYELPASPPALPRSA